MKSRFADGLVSGMQKLLIRSIEQYATSPLQDPDKQQLESFKAQLERGQPLSKKKHQILRCIHDRTVTAAKTQEPS
jgi:hypothetical protein